MSGTIKTCECPIIIILLTKITAVQTEVSLSYHRERRLCFLTVILESCNEYI